MWRARTSRSNIAGPRTNSTGCQLWRPIWFASGSRSSSRLARGQSGNLDHSDRIHNPRRPGPAWIGREPKRLELLRELVPAMTRVAVFVNPANPARAESQVREVESAGRAMRLQIQVLNAGTGRDINAAFATLARERPDALFVSPDPYFVDRRVQIVTLAARHAIPTSFSVREAVEAGGLISYGTNILDTYRQAGVYTGRILKGTKPADLPVVQSTKFELVLNAQTALMLGLEVPPTLLARADEVIE
jgi:putative ABC transport system substrate-binding protein